MKIRGLKNKSVQVTYDGEHPSCGTVFTLRWELVKSLIEQNFKNKNDKVVSIKVHDGGLDIFQETNDMSAHYPMKVQG